MAVFLAVFDNQYAKEKQEMLDTTFYKQVTDSKITDDIQTATDEAKKDGGFYRTVQLGTDDENAANLNRVWNTDQYISSIYLLPIIRATRILERIHLGWNSLTGIS